MDWKQLSHKSCGETNPRDSVLNGSRDQLRTNQEVRFGGVRFRNANGCHIAAFEASAREINETVCEKFVMMYGGTNIQMA